MVFKFFDNPNYKLKEKYLMNTKQTKVSDHLMEKIIKLDNYEKSVDTIKLVYNAILNYFQNGIAEKFSRSSEEIIKSGILSGCNDYGLVTSSILRRLGFPTIFVQSARLDWIEDLNKENENRKRIRGHIFLEVYANAEWVLFDSTRGIIYLKYDIENFSLPNNYYAFSKSKDGWETGCLNLKENNRIMAKVFNNFNLNNYKEPNYQEIRFKKM